MDSKHYGIVDEIITNEGSGVGNLSVSAILGASENYPEARIVIGSTAAAGVDGTAGFAISVRKWRELAQLVNAACRDITAVCPAHGDKQERPRTDATRPQRLRAYLERQLEKLTAATKDASHRKALVADAEEIVAFLQWMDDAGLGK